ncbi:unnamed protein product [Lupinus luteus]|uniref:Integrase zinc-binding domain-containing protein n=1 Tax=Lupinus luteus TaxID=3873 RepID=A0AAV1Y3F0_LUPLU
MRSFTNLGEKTKLLVLYLDVIRLNQSHSGLQFQPCALSSQIFAQQKRANNYYKNCYKHLQKTLTNKNWFFYYKCWLYIPVEIRLCVILLAEYHSTPTARHSSRLKPTMARLTASFFWPVQYKEANEFIKYCLIC